MPSDALQEKVSLARIFGTFFQIGGISFGGGVVAYLRDGLVEQRQWLNDDEFLEALEVSQTLPGLNATNMAILVGQKLRGPLGAFLAILGICLPGALIMLVVGIVYRTHGDHAASTAALKGVAAAAVGLVLFTVVQLGRKSLGTRADYLFVALTVIAVNRLHLSVLTALVGVGLLSIFWHRPRGAVTPERAE